MWQSAVQLSQEMISMRNKVKIGVLATIAVLAMGTAVSYSYADANATEVLDEVLDEQVMDGVLDGEEEVMQAEDMPQDNPAGNVKKHTEIVSPGDGKNIAQGKGDVSVDVPRSLIPADAEEGGKQYKALKNSLFYDFDNLSVKKIVTKVKGDGNFMAEDLGTWLKKRDVYRISVVEDNGEDKKLYYESIPENQTKDEYFSAKDRESLYFDWLVNEGEVITATESCFEEVLMVEPDGSFYTIYSSGWGTEDEWEE